MTRIEPRPSIFVGPRGDRREVRVFVRITDKGNVFHIPAHRLRARAVVAPPKKTLWAWAEQKLFGRAA